MDNIAHLLTVESTDNDATWVTDKWVFSGLGTTRFLLPAELMTGITPDFFISNLTLSAPIVNYHFFLLIDAAYQYQWDTPIVNPYNQSLSIGTHDLNIDLFYSGLNSHLGDIVYLELNNPGGIDSLNSVGFTDLFIPSPYLWRDYRNTAEFFA